jgi:hypothetical protein
MSACPPSSGNPCPSYPLAKCISYTGSNLLCTGIKTNDRLDVILGKIDDVICSISPGTTYIQAGTGIDVDGTGTSGSPYIISASGVGSLTSFSSGSLSPLFTTSVTNPTSTPALSFTLTSQLPNRVFAGPTSGAGSVPTFRALVQTDIPSTMTSYIQNQFAGAQTSSNWWISGHGRIDDYLQFNTGGRMLQTSTGYIGVTSPTDSTVGANFSVNELHFQYPSPANTFSTAYIRSSLTGAQYLDIVAPESLVLYTKAIGFSTSKTDIYPAISVGGLFPLKISGTNTGSAGEWSYLDLVNGWPAGTNSGTSGEGTNVRLLFSANRTTGGKTGFARLGMEVMDFSNAAYKGDLVFETVSAVINSGAQTEYLRLKYDGRIIAASLDTGGTAPTTSGTTRTVISDANGLLSFAGSPLYTGTFTGNGGSATITITHSLGFTPSWWSITPSSAAAGAFPFYVTASSTTLSVIYSSATSAGTNNITIKWAATQ